MEGAFALAWPGLLFPTTPEGRPRGLLALVSPSPPKASVAPHCGQAGLPQLHARPRRALQPGQQGVWSYGPRLRAPGGTVGTLGMWGHLGKSRGHWGHGVWGHLGAQGHLGAPRGHWARGSKRGAL